MAISIQGTTYSLVDDSGSGDAFRIAAGAALRDDETLDEVTVTGNYEAPESVVDPGSAILMQALPAPDVQSGPSETKIATVGELVDKIEDGEARILSGSTTDALVVEVDGKIYIVVGHYAELLVDRALQVNGFFGRYMATYGLARGAIIDHDDEDHVVLDLDGRSSSESA
ncbi:hypothetical protein GCM10007276_09220 [Agaricicola taiwanensis]|uniref:Uncharacterized protein n=1 Tax=Agaricicola taiwanensis TaxID=591372 RepID=A0A8J2YG73_9RHOB|nr:hypothetical protein [Agaricicola taiwanensis]GGE34016.1 hypothetical protein GCM10007276_09220 [Agaricicola taiwanensis]